MNAARGIKHLPRAASVRPVGLLAVVAVVIASASALAQSTESFYKGKTVRLIVASGPGGGYDNYARVLARHMGRFIPGYPSLIVQNMPGASGIKATNFIGTTAPRDGTAFSATYNAMLIETLIGGRTAEFDPLTLTWIGSMGKIQNLCLTWHTSPIKTVDDAMSREVLVSSTGATGNSATLPKLFNQLLGTHFKVVLGYGTVEAKLAVERGDVDGICGYSYSTLMTSNPDWILNQRVNIFLQTGVKPHPKLSDVPLAMDRAKNEDDRALLHLYSIPEEMGRPFVAPPSMPRDRTSALRRAFDATMHDEAFLVEALKANLDVELVTGEEMDALIREAYASPPTLVERMRELVGRERE
jgi:tripartite-type tricarboxylate transporter receptor subunit TctC